MKKDSNSKLKNKQDLKRIATESKVISKKKAKVGENVANAKVIAKNISGNGKAPESAGEDKKNKSKKQIANEAKVEKQPNGKTEKELSEKDLAKQEKKKAKKEKQKLKKKQNKAELKEGGALKPGKKGIQKDDKEGTTPDKNKKNKKINGASSKIEDTKGSKAVVKKQKKAKDVKEKKEPIQRDPVQEAATVFVGNLPVNTKRVQLQRLFQPCGPVIAIRLRTAAGKAIFKHKQRKEAGTLNAYVVFQQVEHAKKALALNGSEFKDNHLRVTAADSKTRDDGDVKRTVFVGNLKYTATEEKLREIFSSCGEIEYIRCLQEGGKGCKGVAYVCFKAPEAVGLALELNETMLDERPIHVERYSVKKLGAKEAREAEASTASVKKPKDGAQLRLAGKQKKKGQPKNAKEGGDNKKKEEFRGVKVGTANGGIAKKKNKKKVTSEMHKLAKKIAPKSK